LKKVQIEKDIEIAYNELGSGNITLLFIHGLANFKGVWQSNIIELSKNYRCIAIDLPGNGHSSNGAHTYSMFFYAECVNQFIEKLNLTNVVLVGHSMGGQIALVLTLRHPNLVKKLILIASSGLEYFSDLDKMMINQSMKMGEVFYSNDYYLENAINNSFFNFDKLAVNGLVKETQDFIKSHSDIKWKRMVNESINAMLNEQIVKFLPTISVDTLVIFGDNDAMIPNKLLHPMETVQKIAEKAKSQIKNSNTLIIKNAGHFVQIEKSAEVNAAIEAFVN
jgi:pimeloyl-ACP methyl ester carboxylesterase